MRHVRTPSPDAGARPARASAARPAALALAVASALAAATACVSALEDPAAAGPDDVRNERLLSPDLLPTPFSAAELRTGNAPGTARTYLVTVDGEVSLERTEFLEHAGGLARFRQERFGLDGASLGEPTEGEAPWEALQAHASYPRAEATLTETTCATAAGRFDAWLYDWRQPAHDDEPAVRHRVWFAKELPGPPVLYDMISDGELVFRMELVEGP